MRRCGVACNPTSVTSKVDYVRSDVRRCYTPGMTMIDLGPERPGHPSDTRQMGEQGRRPHPTDARVSGRAFWIVVLIIAIAFVAIWLLLR